MFSGGEKNSFVLSYYRQQDDWYFNPVRNFRLFVSYYCLVIGFLTGLTEQITISRTIRGNKHPAKTPELLLVPINLTFSVHKGSALFTEL